MEAAEAKIRRVLEGNRQFLVPHYQRPYSWREEQWRTLWRDILELLDDPHSKPHFLASIVTSPARSIPERGRFTDFVRHYLTRFEGVIRETDIYAAV